MDHISLPESRIERNHRLSQEHTASLYSSQLELDFGKPESSIWHAKPASENEKPHGPAASRSSVQNPDSPITLDGQKTAHLSTQLNCEEQSRLQQGHMWRGSPEFAASMKALFQSTPWQSQAGDTSEVIAAKLEMLQDESNKFLKSRGLPPLNFSSFSGQPLHAGAAASYSEALVSINEHLLTKGGQDLADATAHELTHHEQLAIAVLASKAKQDPTFADHDLLSTTSTQFQHQTLASRGGTPLSQEETKRGSQIADDRFIRSGEIQAYWDAKATIHTVDLLSDHLLHHDPNEYLASANRLQETRVDAIETRISFEDHQYRSRLEEKEAFNVGARVQKAYLE